MSITFGASQRYLERQNKDIEQYGKHKVTRKGVNKSVLDKYTPYRRLSNKPCSMSNPDYYIEKFGESTKESLPFLKDWDELSKEEKVDYIVKARYRRLIAHRIMSDNQDKTIERGYSIGENGSIMSVDVGTKTEIYPKNYIAVHSKTKGERAFVEFFSSHFAHIASEMPATTVHNHPHQMDNGALLRCIFLNKSGEDTPPANPFSMKDISASVKRENEMYIIDESGNRYNFVPKPRNEYTGGTVAMVGDVAKRIEMRLKDEYLDEKEKLEEMKKDYKFHGEKAIQKQERKVFEKMMTMLNEGHTCEKYMKLLESDFFRYYIGKFKRIKY